MVGLVVFSVYTAVSRLLDWFQDAAREKGDLYFAAMFFIPVFLAFLLYRVLSRKVVEMTETNASNNGLNHTTDPPGPGPTSG